MDFSNYVLNYVEFYEIIPFVDWKFHKIQQNTRDKKLRIEVL